MVLYYNLKGSERKPLVKAIEEITGVKSKYLGPPSMSYQIGDYNVDKEGTLSWPDLNDADPEFLEQREQMIEQLSELGFKWEYPGYEDEDATELSISIPLEKVDVGNLLHLLEARMNPKTLQYLMGHSDIGVTMNTYTHLGFDDAKDEMIRLEELEQAKKEVERMTEKPKEANQNMFRAI